MKGFLGNRGENYLVRFPITLPDGEELETTWEFTPGRPGQLSGPIESSYPPEPGELVRCSVEGFPGDGEQWILSTLGQAVFDELLSRAYQEDPHD